MINQCLMRLRKTRRASFLYLDEGADEGNIAVMELPGRGPNSEAQLGSGEMSAILRREVRRMPPILSTVLVLRDLEELPMDDVVARLGISLVAAKSRLMRARKELKRCLEKQIGASVRNLIPA